MAVDDVVVDVVPVAADAAVTFQPAAGVEVLIVQVQYGPGPGTQLVLTAGMYDGTNLSGNDEISLAMVAGINAFRMFITNTNYLRYLNDATARDFSYSGVQTK